MTSIDNLKKSLLKDDEVKALDIKKEADAKAADMIKSAETKAKAVMEDMKAKAEKDGMDRKERMLSRAHLDARNSILEAKQKAIDNVLNAAVERVSQMADSEYENLLERMLLNSVETGDEEVIFSKKDKARIQPAFFARVNEKLASSGKKGMLTLSNETMNITSGFVLRRGGLEINNSIEAQIRILRDSLEGEIASLLFEGR